MDKKGILVFLLVAFGLAYVGETLLMRAGLIVFDEPNIFNNIAFVAVMWIPALAGLIASRAVSGPSIAKPRLWPVPAATAVRIALIVPCIFLAVHLICLCFGMRIDWGLGTLMVRVNGMFGNELGRGSAAASVAPAFLLVFGLIFSVVAGATLYAFLALGNELGWRGYLLPRLMPLGRIPAYLISGVLWGLWFLPLIIGWHQQSGSPGAFWGVAVRVIALTCALSIILGAIWTRSRHAGLAAVFLGSFYAQGSPVDSIWSYLFQYPNEPWTGTVGVVSIAVWFLIALLPWVLLGAKEDEGGESGGEVAGDSA